MNGKGSKNRTKATKAFRNNYSLIFPRYEHPGPDRRKTESAHLKANGGCSHNARCRYTHGFHCEDCGWFFPKDSPTYRSTELMSSLWMALHNVNAKRCCSKLPMLVDVREMIDRIGIGIWHDDYEEIISEAKALLKKYKSNVESMSLTLR